MDGGPSGAGDEQDSGAPGSNDPWGESGATSEGASGAPGSNDPWGESGAAGGAMGNEPGSNEPGAESGGAGGDDPWATGDSAGQAGEGADVGRAGELEGEFEKSLGDFDSDIMAEQEILAQSGSGGPADAPYGAAGGRGAGSHRESAANGGGIGRALSWRESA